MIGPLFVRFLLVFGWAFGIFAIFAFTPLQVISSIFQLPLVMGWPGLLLVLFFLGAPVAGYMWLLIFSKREDLKSDATALTGFWIGSTTGSWSGIYVSGTL